MQAWNQQQHLQLARAGVPLLPKLLRQQLSHVQVLVQARVPGQAARQATGEQAAVAASARTQQLLQVPRKQESVGGQSGEQQSLL